VDNVLISVPLVLLLLITVPLVQLMLIDLVYLVLVMLVSMIVVLEFVVPVTLIVLLVLMETVVKPVLKEELIHLIVHVQPENSLTQIMSANLVLTNVLNVLLVLEIVKFVLETDKLPQNVFVLVVISMMVLIQPVPYVQTDVPLVILVTIVSLVPPEELVPQPVVAHPVPLNNVPQLEIISVIQIVQPQPVFHVLINVLNVKLKPETALFVLETESIHLLVLAHLEPMIPVLQIVHLVLINVLLVN